MNTCMSIRKTPPAVGDSHLYLSAYKVPTIDDYAEDGGLGVP